MRDRLTDRLTYNHRWVEARLGEDRVSKIIRLDG
jgi:hypothetical protein